MDSLITVLSLLAAVYAVMPRVTQLSLAVKVTYSTHLMCLLALLVTLYLSYYQFFESRGWAFAATKWPVGLEPCKAAPLVLLGTLFVLIVSLRHGSFAPRQTRAFCELAQRLYWMGSMADLVTLMDKNIERFFDILNQNHWHKRMRDWLVPPFSFQTMIAYYQKHPCPEPDPRFLRIRRQIAKLLPDGGEQQKAAAELASTILLSETFITALANMRPYLAITILQRQKSKFEAEKFLETYIKALTNNSTSVFYAEVAATKTIREERWTVPESSRLLRYFFQDVKTAEIMSVWKPMGDIAVRHIKNFKAHPEDDPYNGPLGDFDTREGQRTLIPTVLQFFDIMVREAFAKGFTFHMWLFYVEYMVKAMVDNYRPAGNVNHEAEFPTKYSWLLYRAFSVLEDWIALLEHATLDQPHTIFNNAESDQSNIPRSAIVALARSLFAITTSEHLDYKLKATFATKAFSLYFRLCHIPGREDYAIALSKSIATGGSSFRPDSRTYVSTLYEIFKEEISEYRMSNAEQDIVRMENVLRALT